MHRKLGIAVLFEKLEDGYRAMARDEAREAEAHAWVEGTSGDVADKVW
jgi:hypothetical protein